MGHNKQLDEQLEGKSKEELIQILCDLVASAPREIVQEWLTNTFLPMLAENKRKRESEGSTAQ